MGRGAVSSTFLERVEVIAESAARLQETLIQYANDTPINDPDLYGDALVELSDLREKIEELSGLLRKYLGER
jgi:hypothetical protein